MLTWAELILAAIALCQAIWVVQLQRRTGKLEAEYKQLLDIQKHQILREVDAKALIQGGGWELLAEITGRGLWLQQELGRIPDAEFLTAMEDVSKAAHDWASSRIADSSVHAKQMRGLLIDVKMNANHAVKAVEIIRSGRADTDSSGLLLYLQRVMTAISGILGIRQDNAE